MKAEYKFSTVIASKTLTLLEWQEVTLKMNTSAIINGSRWHHDSNDNINESKKEERFLVKWSDLSHLHCSWERERDLVQACDGAKQKLGKFRSKSVGGFLYSVDERLDGVCRESDLLLLAFCSSSSCLSHLNLSLNEYQGLL
jgi:hypothetical protein